MYSHSRVPVYIVLDLRDVMNDYARHHKNYSLYQKFPLQEIVQTILSTAAYYDQGEYFWQEVERRFSDCLDEINFDILSFFYEMLTEYLDQTIRRKVPEEIDSYSYVFHKWVDTNTVILQHDSNAQASRCPV